MASVVVSGIVAALHNLFPAIPLSPVDASGGLGAMFDTAQATFGIVDSGSNSNGSYVKFADGTMECWGRVVSSAYPDTVTFPASFIDTNYRLVVNHLETSIANIVSNESPTVRTVAGTAIWSNVGNTGASHTTGSIEWHAIGRWK